MKKRYVAILTVGVVFGFLLGLVAVENLSVENPTEADVPSEGVTIRPVYRVTQYRPGVGIIYEADVGNLITNAGLNLVRDKMTSYDNSSSANATWMALSNDTLAGAATDTNISNGNNVDVLPGEYQGRGLNRAIGETSFGQNGGTEDPGNWSVSYKWTATVDSSYVWKFGIFNGSTLWDGTDEGSTMFSVGNFSTNVSMQINDELTVNVTYIVSSGT